MVSPHEMWRRDSNLAPPFEMDSYGSYGSFISPSTSTGHLFPDQYEIGLAHDSGVSFGDSSYRTGEIDIPRQAITPEAVDQLTVIEDCEIRGWQFHALVQYSSVDRRLTLNPTPADESLLEDFMSALQAEGGGAFAQHAPESDGVFDLDW